jgi:hypothetical protein
MDGAAEKWRAEISNTPVVEISGVSADMRRANELKSPWTGLFQQTLKARLDYLIYRKDAKGAKFWITVISSLRTLRLCGESGRLETYQVIPNARIRNDPAGSRSITAYNLTNPLAAVRSRT